MLIMTKADHSFRVWLCANVFVRSTGAIAAQGQVKRVPLTYYLIVRYNIDWKVLVNAPQGSKEEIAKAQAFLDQVQAAFQESEARDAEASAALEESRALEAEAKEREKEAKAREEEAKERETEAKAREAEAKVSILRLKYLIKWYIVLTIHLEGKRS